MPFTVVGILKPTGTVIDRVVITPIESVWHVHEHPDEDDAEEIAHKHDHPEQEVTALLISYKSPLAAAQLPRMINSNTSMQAASPAFEVARLTKLMGTGSELLSVFGVLLMTFSAFGFFVTLSNAINERMRDIALIRSLGAPRMRVTNLILGEALVLGIAGIVAGIVLTYVLQTGVRITVENIHHITLPPAVLGDTELITIGTALALSIVSAIVPACRAYRLRITEILARS